MLLPRFVHFLGLTLWIGGAISAFVVVRSIQAQSVSYRIVTWSVLARIHSMVIAPGAILTVFSGLLLTVRMTNAVAVPMSTGLVVMQVAGVLAAMVALFVGLPTANQLVPFSRMGDQDVIPPEAARLVRRQAVASSLSGMLALTALFFGVVVR
jgi:hypothetical protein